MTPKNLKLNTSILSFGLSGAFVGTLVGGVFGVWFVFYFGFIEYLRDSSLIVLSMTIGSVLLGFIGGVLLAVLLLGLFRLVKDPEPMTSISKWWFRIVLIAVFQTLIWTLWIQIQRPFEFHGWVTLFEFIIALAISFLFAEIIRNVTKKQAVPILRKMVMIAGVVAVCWFVVFVSHLASGKSQRTATFSFHGIIDSEYKVAILGIDGATWDVIDKLFAQGRLPNIKSLISKGIRAPLLADVSILNPFANSSSRGMRSCSAWTSIGTGRTYREHRLHDFLNTYVPGLTHPVPFRIPYTTKIGSVKGKFALKTLRPTSRDKGTLAVWDIVSLAGLRAGVLGWWVSWPPTAIDGYLITDRLLENSPFRWYPQDLFEEDPAKFKFENPSEIVTRFADIQYSNDKSVRKILDAKERRIMQRFDILLKDLKRDSIVYRKALELLEKEQPELFAVYFLSPDNSEHLFWKYMDPEPFGDVGAEEIEKLGEVIPRSYDFLDRWVGKIVSLLDDNTVVLICSDHGFGPWNKKGGLISGKKLWPLNSGNHRRNGVLIISGEPIKNGVVLKKAKQIDIVPTTLALLGLPVPKDMKGRVLIEAFEEAFEESFEACSFASINSYEQFRPAPFLTDAVKDTGLQMDQEYMERLKALGYIGGDKGK